VDCVIEAEQLAILVTDVSKVLTDLGMSSIPGIPWDPHTIAGILEMVDIILERLLEAYTSDHGP
jgi:hypothetical protein